MSEAKNDSAAACRAVRIRIDDLVLRVPTSSETSEIAAIAGDGVHPPEYMPFSVPWSDTRPQERARNIESWMTRRIESSTPESWTFVVGVLRSGQWVGCTNLFAKDFVTSRTVSTGSWLGLPFQGQGIGKRMRTGLLSFAFEYLDCKLAQSEVFADNARSRAVNESAGYVVVRKQIVERRGIPAELLHFELSKDRWDQSDHLPVEVDNAEGLRESIWGTLSHLN